MPHASAPHVSVWKRFAVLAVLLTVSACGAEQDVTVIKLGHALATDHPVHRAMEFMAERLKEEVGAGSADQARHAFLLTFSRPPTAAELRDSTALIDDHDLVTLCRALINSNEFLFIP